MKKNAFILPSLRKFLSSFDFGYAVQEEKNLFDFRSSKQ